MNATIVTWKACKEELPDVDRMVLVHRPDNNDPVWFGYYNGKRWRIVSIGVVGGVTHWADLPEPPTEGAK